MKIRLPHGVKTELSFAYDVDKATARFLGYGRSSYALATSSEVCGTFDVVKPGYVGDYKTGHAVLDHASSSAQLKFGALCIDALWKTGDGVDAEYIFVRPGAKEASYDKAFYSHSQLLSFGELVNSTVALVRESESGKKLFREGLHCRHCPAFDFCPAKREMLMFLSRETDLAEGYRRTREIEYMAKRALERLKEIAGEAPIDLGNGRYYGLSRRERFEEYVVNDE